MKKMMIIGNVGRDPEVKTDDVGNLYASFVVAVTAGTKAEPKTDWININCNGKLVDVAKNYIKKGHKLFVEGYPKAHSYSNSEGQQFVGIRIFASQIELLSYIEEDNG